MPTANEIAMLQAAREAGITSRDELANLMGQLSHETGGFSRLEEGFRYTRGLNQIPVPSVLREGRQAAEAARLEALEGRPQELARLMYGGRLGNNDAGDGYRYRGRGFIQLTGENNYRVYGTTLGLDLVGQPDLAANLENASRIALSYWQQAVLLPERDDVSEATQAINGGLNGLADRHNRFDAWHAQLTPEFMADLAAGRIQPGPGVGPAVGREAIADGALRRLETGPEVRQLQSDLRALGITTDSNRELGVNGDYGPATEQAVRRFQEQRGLAVTGRAGPETLTAIQDGLRQRGQPPQPAQPGVPGVRGPEIPERRGDNGQPEGIPQQNPQAQTFPTNNRDYPLFAAIKQQLPDAIPDEKLAFIVLQAKHNGVHHVDRLDKVIVHEGSAWVTGKTIGEWAKVDLSGPAPPLQDTLRQSDAFDLHRAQQLAQWQQEDLQLNQAAQEQGSGARTLG